MNLSPHYAFVVQLSAETPLGAKGLIGRVEHVVSHRSARFECAAELLAFMATVIEQMRERDSLSPAVFTPTPPDVDKETS